MGEKLVAKETLTKPAAKTRVKKERAPRVWSKPLRAIGSYFKGAWIELRQVHWPNRRATWALTLAVILFSVFFFVVILGLDTLFQYLFKEVLL